MCATYESGKRCQLVQCLVFINITNKSGKVTVPSPWCAFDVGLLTLQCSRSIESINDALT